MATNIQTRNIKLKGGDIPEGTEYEITLTIDYTDVSIEELLPRAFASDVITWQRRARKTAPAVLKNYAEKGCQCKHDEFIPGRTQVVDVRQVFTAMGYDEKTVDLLMNNRELVEKMLSEAGDDK